MKEINFFIIIVLLTMGLLTFSTCSNESWGLYGNLFPEDEVISSGDKNFIKENSEFLLNSQSNMIEPEYVRDLIKFSFGSTEDFILYLRQSGYGGWAEINSDDELMWLVPDEDLDIYNCFAYPKSTDTELLRKVWEEDQRPTDRIFLNIGDNREFSHYVECNTILKVRFKLYGAPEYIFLECSSDEFSDVFNCIRGVSIFGPGLPRIVRADKVNDNCTEVMMYGEYWAGDYEMLITLRDSKLVPHTWNDDSECVMNFRIRTE